MSLGQLRRLAQQLAELGALKNDSGLQKEIEFEIKLRALLAEYGCTLKNVIKLLDPQANRHGATQFTPKTTSKAREVKVYKHSQTGRDEGRESQDA